ncbi:GtrA family protein [Paeniglutamicibacter antarcticus]|uniref:GtrA family protein n=1 Tax=Arthrobacter terrae TaxID=2935737 RepID=A0A931CU62_9MICC|nr:GtrA family protein [Arthrobacter terrae]MBG0741469.1 GtrA family protein [Arthrobacter terrae]
MRIPAESAAARPDETVKSSARGRAGIRHQVRGFLIVGAVCTVASVAIFALIRPLVGLQWANLVSLVLTSVLNTDLNRRHSFGITERARWIGDQRRGLWVMLLALGLTSGSLWLLHTVAPDASVLDELLVITAANVLAAVTRFLLLRYWIFRRIRNS